MKKPGRTVILGHHSLLGHRTQLDLDVHHPQVLARHVHLDEPRIDRLVELAEPGDETDGSLRDGFVRVGELATAVDKQAGDQDDSIEISLKGHRRYRVRWQSRVNDSPDSKEYYPMLLDNHLDCA